MPELPEVETIRRELTPHITGRSITSLTLIWKGIIPASSEEGFRARLIGQEITGLYRRGKYLAIRLASGDSLIIHLRMTGSLLLKSGGDQPERFVRAVIHLDRNISIHFRDPRKFGLMWLCQDTDSLDKKLGVEPLEASFTADLLASLLKNRKAPIKALLLEQKLIAGIGNMYADESLFSAGIHPLRPGGSLSKKEVKRLHRSIRKILRAAIEQKGASVNTYYRPGGEEGIAQFSFRVAHRLGGNNCSVCDIPIERVTVRNRGTYFCPACQPEVKTETSGDHRHKQKAPR
ncbi:MAG: bifunctional DNA-formamidopyrimidine glycosylase/DNA-(apurinic or apyrimidinic site) lyase [Dehalococcoidales bacterium]